MTFNSPQFVLFFIAVATAYFLMPYRFRWLLLLGASCYFYMAFIPAYVLILLAMVVIDYFAGIFIEKSSGHRRKFFLILSICSNIGILAFFKYFNFFSVNLTVLARFLDWNYSLPLLSLALPLGLSFHTFQALSYTIEVYRGKHKAERHFGIYALYVMFFPQLVAGPIERPQHLLPQLHQNHDFDYERVTTGLKRMAWGFFKKMVVADHLAIMVNIVYGNPQKFSGPALILATVFFAFQLYSDFSAYTDIALGSAQVLGIKLVENFERPFFSKSIAEFWRRWHISLSTWFRDYVFYPLAFGSKNTTRLKLYFAIMATFLLSGLWHGAGWTYVVMGGLYGFFICFSQATKAYRDSIIHFFRLDRAPALLRLLRVGTTFVLACIAWIFFRAVNLTDAWYILFHLGSGLGSFLDRFYSYYVWKNLLSLNGAMTDRKTIIVCLLGIAVIMLSELLQRQASLWQWLPAQPAYARWPLYYLVVGSILLFGVFGAKQFIYFQF